MSSVPAKTLSVVSGPGRFRCREIVDRGEATVRLKRIGICAGREIEVVRAGNPMILRVCGVCVGVSRSLSGLIVLEESASVPVAAKSETVATGDC